MNKKIKLFVLKDVRNLISKRVVEILKEVK